MDALRLVFARDLGWLFFSTDSRGNPSPKKLVRTLQGEVWQQGGYDGHAGCLFRRYEGWYFWATRFSRAVSKNSYSRNLDGPIHQSVIPRDFPNRRIIGDRSKADGLVKLVTCLQASWMFMQCVVRKTIGLPVTLLEFHVTIQVVCAVVMYGIWWYKPCNAHEPVLVMNYR